MLFSRGALEIDLNGEKRGGGGNTKSRMFVYISYNTHHVEKVELTEQYNKKF